MTPTQDRIMKLLEDGNPHTIHEIKSCLNDELADVSNVPVQIFRIRAELRAMDYNKLLVSLQVEGITYYQLQPREVYGPYRPR